MRKKTAITLFLLIFVVSCASPIEQPTVTPIVEPTLTVTATLTPSPTETTIPTPTTTTPAEEEIKTVVLTYADGTSIAVPSFETKPGPIDIEENSALYPALNYIINEEGAIRNVFTLSKTANDGATWFKKFFTIKDAGNEVRTGIPVGILGTDDYVRVMVYDLGSGTLLAYIDRDNNLKLVHLSNISASSAKSGLLNGFSVEATADSSTSTP